MGRVELSAFNNNWYKPGRGLVVRSLWYFINAILLQSPINPSSRLKVIFLRLFGARIGKGVVVKPSVNVKYPWKLEIGDHSWIGENTWLDSLAPIIIGSNACISQGVYFCTGSHDATDPAFGLIVKQIVIEDGVWVGARATILPGVTVKSHSILAAGSVIAKDTEPYGIYVGNPAVRVKERRLMPRK